MAAGAPDSVVDTISIPSVITSSKVSVPVERMSSPVSTFFLKDIEREGLKSPKTVSSLVPNLHIPDYGSAMTSTIYIRGLGSRIDNPVMGLYIDDIPILDKNAYDADFHDIRRIDVFRGPQGTIHGRNTMAGLMTVETISPSDYQGIRGAVEYGSFGTFSARISAYRDSLGISAALRHSDGYYKNTYDDTSVDRTGSASLRIRLKASLFGNPVDNTLSVNAIKQRGYPYRHLREDGSLSPINYNGYSGYERLSIIDGLKLRRSGERFNITSISSLQALFDRMDMDQDFTTRSMFTLRQAQRQAAVTQELILKPAIPRQDWTPTTGVFALFRYNAMSAPVTFKEDGINDLILSNANAHMPDYYGTMAFIENTFPITSDFGIGTYNVAAYHESRFTRGRWLLTSGVRLDFEGNFMTYDSHALVHFYFNPDGGEGVNPCETSYKGTTSNIYFQILPKLAVLYDAGDIKLFANATKGYKAGGFNTQIFSDILQNLMMNDLMGKLGVHMDRPAVSVGAGSTSYKPEESWNLEAGLRLSRKIGHTLLRGTASAYLIDVRHQQLTIFPAGKSTGRMMANAGRTLSRGIEATLSLDYNGLNINASVGTTDARFKDYNDGNNDYSGKHVPYAPTMTSSLGGSWRLDTGNTLRAIILGVNWNRTGRIYWNEDNTALQAPYSTLSADITFAFNKFDIYFRGSNLTGTQYGLFYFKSIGNEFMQMARPRSLTAGISFNL